MIDSSEVSRCLDVMLRASDVIHDFLENIEMQKLLKRRQPDHQLRNLYSKVSLLVYTVWIFLQ